MFGQSGAAWFAVFASIAWPAVSAETTTIDVASTFPLGLPLFSETTKNITRQVSNLTNGEVTLVFHQPGDLAAATQALDMVATGKIAAAWSTPGVFSKHGVAFEALSSLPFGPDINEYMAWLLQGGGLQLSRKMFAAHDIYNVPCLVFPPEGAGWFTKEIRTDNDLKGLKIRYFGLGGRVLSKLGAKVVPMPAGEIIGAMERHDIEAAEYSVPSMDLMMGLNKVAGYYYFPGWHQQTTLYELYFNKTVWDRFDPKQKETIETACSVAMRDGLARAAVMQIDALRNIKSSGTKLRRWSPRMLLEFEAAWTVVANELRNTDASFREVIDSYDDFRQDYVYWKRFGYLH